jgi:cobyrinic acid a,c-diamide synthase
MDVKGIMIAAPSSGTGKTTVSIGIMRALSDMGFKVQPFKVGPDYIDPGFHWLASGNKSYNIDTVMGNAKTAREIYFHNSSGKDISVVEGVMGLFDGKAGNSIKGSSFDISLTLGIPVILVIDISASGRSSAALVRGFRDFDKRLNLKGVILNRAGSDYHCRLVREAIEKSTGIRVLGCLKRYDDLKIGSRYLGLVTAGEEKINDSYFKRLSTIIKSNIDIPEIIRIAGMVNYKKIPKPSLYNYRAKGKCRIGVAYNKAFTFYYTENLELLEKFGAKIVFFDPIIDTSLPDVDGLYLGGGYPELYAEELSGNVKLLAEIRESIENNMPVFAECGGYMYLSESISIDGKEYPMAGTIPGKTHMESLSLGYRKIMAATEGTILNDREKIMGHEFHYSRIVFNARHPEAYRFENGNTEGFTYKQLIAGYAHLYFPSNQNFPRRFVERCAEYKIEKREIIY